MNRIEIKKEAVTGTDTKHIIALFVIDGKAFTLSIPDKTYTKQQKEKMFNLIEDAFEKL